MGVTLEGQPDARRRTVRSDAGSAPGRTRTADAGLRTASLYPLSYGGAAAIVACRARQTEPSFDLWLGQRDNERTSAALTGCSGASYAVRLGHRDNQRSRASLTGQDEPSFAPWLGQRDMGDANGDWRGQRAV